MKAYEDQVRAQHHYQRVLSAKSSIPSKTTRRKSLIIRSQRYPQFMNDYQVRQTNNKLVGKLKQIYDGETARIYTSLRLSTKSKDEGVKRKGSLVNEYKQKQHFQGIDQDNLKLFNRIISVRPTVENFKEREKKLKSYSKISSKSFCHKRQDSLFLEFKKKLLNESVSNGVNTNFDKVEKKKKRKKKYKVMSAYEVLYNVD